MELAGPERWVLPFGNRGRYQGTVGKRKGGVDERMEEEVAGGRESEQETARWGRW